MKILKARITNARIARDFGMVEANVALLINQPGLSAPIEVNVLTCAPRPKRRRPGALRAQLIQNAAQLYARMAGLAFDNPAPQFAA